MLCTMNATPLSDEAMNMVVGGRLETLPDEKTLAEFGLSDIVVLGGWGFFDQYYRTLCGCDSKGNKSWKTVSSKDMLNYVARQLGEDDPTYKRFAAYCNNAEYFHDVFN